MFEAISATIASNISGFPEIVHIEYDLSTLRLNCSFGDSHAPIYLEFTNVEGFRVLDEGQLCTFWSSEPRASGWLWDVKAGGWFALESTRSDFILGLTSSIGNELRDFIVLGINDCVNVLTWDQPRIQLAEP